MGKKWEIHFVANDGQCRHATIEAETEEDARYIALDWMDGSSAGLHEIISVTETS